MPAHVAADSVVLFFFMAEQYSMAYTYHSCFAHSPVDQHLGCLLFLSFPFIHAGFTRTFLPELGLS